MNLSTPLPMTSLGELVDAVLDEVDNEITRKQAVRWVNQELGSLSTKREWNFFFIYGDIGNVAVMDPTTNTSILQLPNHVKKLFKIYTYQPAVNGTPYMSDSTRYEQGTNYELQWNQTRMAYDVYFKNLGNSTVTQVYIDYYIEPLRLVSDLDQTRVPDCFANVIILGVLRRAKIKLMDTDEAILHDRQYKEELQSMIDDDAREHDLPQTLQPSRHQTPDEYEQYFQGQAWGENGLNGLGVALTRRYI